MKMQAYIRFTRLHIAAALMLLLAARLLPDFAEAWSAVIALPVLRILARMADAVPLVLMECCAIIAAADLVIGLLRRCFLRRFARLCSLMLCGYFMLWYPLYFIDAPKPQAGADQIAQLGAQLIDQLNAAQLDFDILPTLPAKYVRFPQWMQRMKLGGFCAFWTGEALIPAELDRASQPFVAVHERMHMEGHADEGAANIAAWDACMARGGVFADSARIWALRYAMGALRRMDFDAYEANLHRMNARSLRVYREAGGAYMPDDASGFGAALLRALGIDEGLRNYEILVHHLAANRPQ